jgi:hypothetical protein
MRITAAILMIASGIAGVIAWPMFFQSQGWLGFHRFGLFLIGFYVYDGRYLYIDEETERLGTGRSNMFPYHPHLRNTGADNIGKA